MNERNKMRANLFKARRVTLFQYNRIERVTLVQYEADASPRGPKLQTLWIIWPIQAMIRARTHIQDVSIWYTHTHKPNAFDHMKHINDPVDEWGPSRANELLAIIIIWLSAAFGPVQLWPDLCALSQMRAIAQFCHQLAWAMDLSFLETIEFKHFSLNSMWATDQLAFHFFYRTDS